MRFLEAEQLPAAIVAQAGLAGEIGDAAIGMTGRLEGAVMTPALPVEAFAQGSGFPSSFVTSAEVTALLTVISSDTVSGFF